jgi:putative chitinase
VITPAEFAAAVPRSRVADRAALTAGANAMFAEASVRTRAGAAMVLAQLAHESGSFMFRQEFASGSAYEGRADLGNVEQGDGPRYRGRGWIQLTGRANYRAAGLDIGEDLETEPERAAEPEIAWRVAAWFWRTRGLADVTDLERVTRRINGGTNGLADRKARYAWARAALGVM